MYGIRTKPEPFYCYYKDKDQYLPFNTLRACMCEIQCIVCENYQDGMDGYNPKRVPAIQYEIDYDIHRIWLWRVWDEDYLYVRSWPNLGLKIMIG